MEIQISDDVLNRLRGIALLCDKSVEDLARDAIETFIETVSRTLHDALSL